MNYLIVIIINEEFFNKNESNIYNRIKEKTVNKFLTYNPSYDELFTIIFNTEKKYKNISFCTSNILPIIQTVGVKNARIYKSILDNCYEYNKFQDKGVRAGILELKFLTVITIFWNKYNKILPFAGNSDFHPDVYNLNVMTCLIDLVNQKTKWSIDKLFTRLNQKIKQLGVSSTEVNIAADFISDNIKELYDISLYNGIIPTTIIKEQHKILCDFVESGILV